MVEDWQLGLLNLIITLNEIVTAGVAITAFSLLLYSFAFNLRDKVARFFALIMICVVIVYSADAIGSVAKDASQIEFWLRVQWVGIILLPVTYLQFSDALLATTGLPSRGKRTWAVRLTALFSVFLLGILPTDILVGPLLLDVPPTAHLTPTIFTDIFTFYYVVMMLMAWINFFRAYKRTVSATSRKRMGYLVISALAPALGSFPFLLYGSNLASRHQFLFWIVALLANLFVEVLIVIMAYAVAFFGVSWPDRVVKRRLFKWIMRGPFTASATLAITTLMRRTGVVFNLQIEAFIPIIMVVTILLMEYFITIFAPMGEKLLFWGNETDELEALSAVQDRLLTKNDVKQFLEMILAAVCDRLQAPGGYIASLQPSGLELAVMLGKNQFEEHKTAVDVTALEQTDINAGVKIFTWGTDILIPLQSKSKENGITIMGLLGISDINPDEIDEEQRAALKLLAGRAALALKNAQIQTQIFNTIEELSPDIDYIQRLRAAGRYDSSKVLNENVGLDQGMVDLVKDALTHFWGGPKLTESPLIDLQIVREEMQQNDGNSANALRTILRNSIENLKPDGERRYTGEWILYNILEMKFLEGRKVREIALKLSMSEADLYRKQRVAIEAVAKAIAESEEQARSKPQ